MGDSLIGVEVPAMKKPEEETTITSSTTTKAEFEVEAEAKVADKELLCPICMQMIKDVFLTACGHSFCYMCIVTHLRNKSNCPCCSDSLTPDQLFPNFLLDKLLKKTSTQQLSKNASPAEQFHQSLEQGCEVSIKELDTLLYLLAEKKRKMEQEEAERNMQILLEFLYSLRKQKVNELNEVQNDIHCVKEDLNAVERHRIELYRARDSYSVKLRLLGDDPMGLKSPTSSFNRISTSHLSSGNERGGILSENFQHKKVEEKARLSFLGLQRKDTSSSGPTSQHLNQASLAVKQKKRVHAQFNDLQEFYLQKRRQSTTHLPSQNKDDKGIIHREGYNAGLADVQSVLSTFTRYSRLRVIAELRHGDRFHSTNIVSSSISRGILSVYSHLPSLWRTGTH